MTSFKNLFSLLIKPRFKRMNMWLLVEVVAIAILILINGFQQGFTGEMVLGTTTSIGALAMVASFIILTIGHEKIYTQDTYRLIPISDTKLYLGNQLSSFVTYLYVIVMQVVLVIIAALMNHANLANFFQTIKEIQSVNAGDDFSNLAAVSAAMVPFLLTLIILAWTTISLAHLIMRAAQNFLPNFSQKIIRIVLNIVLVVAALYFFGLILNGIASFENLLPNQNFVLQLIFSTISMWVIVVLESVGSVYLLHRWVETVA